VDELVEQTDIAVVAETVASASELKESPSASSPSG